MHCSRRSSNGKKKQFFFEKKNTPVRLEIEQNQFVIHGVKFGSVGVGTADEESTRPVQHIAAGVVDIAAVRDVDCANAMTWKCWAQGGLRIPRLPS